MNSRVRWRIVVAVVVTLGISVFAWYPLLADRFGVPLPDAVAARRVHLGLDLRGGVQMVLRVNTDDALLVETRAAAARIGEELTRDGVNGARADVLGPRSFRVEGVNGACERARRGAAGDAAAGFAAEPSAGGGCTFAMTAAHAGSLRAAAVDQARSTVDRRVNELGVAEPIIAIQGAAADEIVVQLPGAGDLDRARSILGATALLEWKLVERGPAVSPEALLAFSGGVVPQGQEVVAEASGAGSAYYLVHAAPVVTGRDLRAARPTTAENSQPAVAFSLTSDGARRFAQVTGENVGRALAIVLDGRVQSAPQIQTRIDGGEGYILGRFTHQEAADLSLVLRAGALPASLTYLGGRFVGPSLGAASIQAGVTASLAGLGLVAGFILLYYNRAGVNAVISIVANLLILLGLLAYSGAALTLPGIAGLILTIGMGVDSNVLIFERIKEELAAGRGTRAAVAAGFDRVFLTILDTHAASLIAAAFLFQFGTGPIRGFATTLTFGLLANVFTAVFLSRTLFELALSSRPGATLRIRTFPARARAFGADFFRWRRWAMTVSALVIVAGASAALLRGGIPLGVEFTGGTSMSVKFVEPVAEERVRHALPDGGAVQRYGDAVENELLVRVPQLAGADDGAPLAQEVARVTAALAGGGLPAFEVTGSETIGPAIGEDLRRKGVYASLAALSGIAAYIAVRFRPAFAAGALAATLHDVLVTLSVLTLAGYDLSLNVVAALLTITGYSVNDTIVTFDRVREHLRRTPAARLRDVVNTSINETLTRTCITGGTTLLAVAMLYLFGGDVLEGFAFAMLVGIVSGIYSTVFIAGTMLTSRGRRRDPRAAGVV